jgi:predicted DNA-binding transcriptional regulator AlpA
MKKKRKETVETTGGEMLTIQELAAKIKKSEVTLQRWRTNGEGPRFVKCGKSVLYPLDEVEGWLEKSLRESTAG